MIHSLILTKITDVLRMKVVDCPSQIDTACRSPTLHSISQWMLQHSAVVSSFYLFKAFRVKNAFHQLALVAAKTEPESMLTCSTVKAYSLAMTFIITRRSLAPVWERTGTGRLDWKFYGQEPLGGKFKVLPSSVFADEMWDLVIVLHLCAYQPLCI